MRHFPMLLLSWLLLWLPPGGALPLTQDHSPAFLGPSGGHSSLDVSRFRELRKRYEHLQARLLLNQTQEDWNADPIPVDHVRILTPKLRLGPDGHLRLHALRADLTEGLPAGSRLRQALLRLSPQAPGSWDLTRQLQRQLRLGGPAAPALSLRLPRRGGPVARGAARGTAPARAALAAPRRQGAPRRACARPGRVPARGGALLPPAEPARVDRRPGLGRLGGGAARAGRAHVRRRLPGPVPVGEQARGGTGAAARPEARRRACAVLRARRLRARGAAAPGRRRPRGAHALRRPRGRRLPLPVSGSASAPRGPCLSKGLAGPGSPFLTSAVHSLLPKRLYLCLYLLLIYWGDLPGD
uniref:Uncharacterized protein n=1 Tax=Equus asinus TaxID=9793 RepID=A0A9L0IJA7_EQUAS